MSLTTTGAGSAAGGGVPGLRRAVTTVAGDGVVLTFDSLVEFFGGASPLLVVKANGSQWADENDLSGTPAIGITQTLIFGVPPLFYGDVVTITFGDNEFGYSPSGLPVPGVTDFHVRNTVPFAGITAASIDPTGFILRATFTAAATFTNDVGWVLKRDGSDFATSGDLFTYTDGSVDLTFTFSGVVAPLPTSGVYMFSYAKGDFTHTVGGNDFPGATDFPVTNYAVSTPTVTLTALSSTSISVAFSSSTGTVTGYHSKYGTVNPPLTTGPDGSASPIVLTGLLSGTLYYARVAAYNTAGTGSYSLVIGGRYTLTAAPTYAVAPHDDSSEGIAGTITAPTGETASQYDYSLNGGSTWANLTNTAGAFDISTGPGTFSFTTRGYNGDGAPGDQAVPVTVVVLPFELDFAVGLITPVSAGPTLFSRAVA